ncbi:hypothetical protein GMORB2_5808 [Geosmithia morbida]|uniref:Uncharacterized protein n=1 Tax=Geosmithia morbida TaxID=1094350 RepID=A0A9P4YX11_9HYPO|nr:uncharacterized protein GMORB2_5808 [Geosmithia morbida]KAF4124092.1 hypothetical protein GMORB2_5808 [Geosmithia morbida]
MSLPPGSAITDGLAISTTTTPSLATPTSASAVSAAASGNGVHYAPLTTNWETPLSCTWTFDISQVPGPGTPGPIAFLDLEPDPDATTLSCYPDGMFYEQQTGTFSPATCPNGWTTVSLRQDEDASQTMATTTAVCCSSEYSLDGSICKREQPTILAVPIVYNTTDGSYMILTDETSTLTSATLAVHTIQALFQDSDKEMLGLTDDETICEEPSDHRGLSLGARIGIGIGTTIGGVMLIALGLWILLTRRRKSVDEKLDSELDSDFPAMRNAPLHPQAVNTVNTANASIDMPPPAYEFSARNSVTDDESRDGDDDSHDDNVSTMQGGEIEILRAQKAAIQRRIEELQNGDGTEGQGRR